MVQSVHPRENTNEETQNLSSFQNMKLKLGIKEIAKMPNAGMVAELERELEKSKREAKRLREKISVLAQGKIAMMLCERN